MCRDTIDVLALVGPYRSRANLPVIMTKRDSVQQVESLTNWDETGSNATSSIARNRKNSIIGTEQKFGGSDRPKKDAQGPSFEYRPSSGSEFQTRFLFKVCLINVLLPKLWSLLVNGCIILRFFRRGRFVYRHRRETRERISFLGVSTVKENSANERRKREGRERVESWSV